MGTGDVPAPAGRARTKCCRGCRLGRLRSRRERMQGARDQRALATRGRRALLTPPHRARTGTCYNDTGLFGLYFTANMDDKYKTHDLFHHVQEEMVAITTGVSDEDVVRGWAESVGGREGGRGFLGCGV